MMTFRRLQRGWCPLCLPLAALTGLLAGCSMPGKGGGGPLAGLRPVTTASYREHAIDEGPPKKVKDALTLKLQYAKWMEEIENYNEAQANYNIVLQERPEDIDAILGLARIDQAADRKDDAETGFQKALSLRPDSVVAKNALGQYYASQNRLAEALPLLNAAMLGEPDNKLYRFHLAVALAKSGDTAAAFPHFSQSVGEATAHYNIGMILKSQGQYRQAEQQFMQALTRNPEFEAARQAMSQMSQQAQAAETYGAQQGSAPRIHPAGHSRPASLSPAQQQLRNQRSLRQ